jgi:replication-associated recombination protein RarA
LEIRLPPPVKEHDKLNLILIGPNSVGRTTVANYMAQEHQRCVIRVDMLVDYWLKRGGDLADEITKV